jgi:flavin reductase (DIM6/NTAB) family NADH-FMN oxidoreductase RutF
MAMRQLPFPIVLLTTSDGTVDRSRDTKNYGVILSTFNTVSMVSPPMISFNIKLPSHSYDIIREGKHFFVNFLSATPLGAKVADAFIKHSHDRAFEFCRQHYPGLELSWEAMLPSSETKSTPAAWVLSGEATIANLACELIPEQCMPVADHVICVAKVHGVAKRSKDQTSLLHWQGEYGSAGLDKL